MSDSFRSQTQTPAPPRLEIRTGWLERTVIFGTGLILLAGLFWFFRPHDFLVYLFLWPAAGLALWAMVYAVLARNETWRFDDRTVVRRKHNWLQASETAWAYDQIADTRIRAAGVTGRDGYRLEMRLGSQWLALPAQKTQATAERMRAELDGRRQIH